MNVFYNKQQINNANEKLALTKKKDATSNATGVTHIVDDKNQPLQITKCFTNCNEK